MAHKSSHNHERAKGYQPSPSVLDLDTATSRTTPPINSEGNRSQAKPSEGEDAHANAGANPSTSGEAKASEGVKAAKRGAKWCDLADGAGAGGPGGGYGGQRGGRPGRPGNARGPLGQTRSGLGIGVRVRNVSGRGVWGFGSIVAVIPSGVNPRWFCRRNGMPVVFGRRCDVVYRERYIVLGDDGRHHIPRNVEVV